MPASPARALTILLCSMLVVLAACDGGGAADGGVDAAAPDSGAADAAPPDAGPMDAGPADGGPPDAGPLDGGPPTPVETAAEVETDLDTALSMRDAIPMDMRLDGAFVSLDIAAAGIDAIIGEKGLGTLSLSDAAVRAHADLRTCNVLLDVLERALDGLVERSEPAVIALHAQLLVLRGSLAAHRDVLGRLFLERRDLGIPGTPEIRDSFFEIQSAFGAGRPSRLAFVAEGQAPTAPEASLIIECFSGAELDVRVVDEATGAELASMPSGGTGTSFAVPLTYDESAAIAVVVGGNNVRGAMGEYPECMVQLTGRRRLRVPPVMLDDTQTAYFTARGDVASAQFQLGMTTSALFASGTLDPTVVAAVDAQAGVILQMVAMLLPSDSSVIPVETRERLAREAAYVRAMTAATLASPSLAATEADSARLGLQALQDAADALVAALVAITP